MIVLTVVLAFCLAVTFWAYAGYPLLLLLLDRVVAGREVAITDARPTVTLVISCYNEEAVIGRKLDNTACLNYPRDRLQVVVVSDGSTDATDAIVESYAQGTVRLVRQEPRRGKTSGLNLALATIDSEIVVFSDANAMYAPDAIDMLVRNFGDPAVGYVVGAALYTDTEEGASARSEGTYWNLEMTLKRIESRLHSVVGGDGAIYAIRREFYTPLEVEDINDFVNPLQIILLGKRGVFEPAARCFEETSGDFQREAARKERIVNRSIRGLMRQRGVMNPARTGFFSLAVISHKLLRWLAPFFMAMALVTLLPLSVLAGQWTLVLSGGAAVLSALALVAHLSRRDELPRALALPYYFFLVNIHCMRGVMAWLGGHTQVTWTTHRATPGTAGRRAFDATGRLLSAALLTAVVAMMFGLA